MNGLRFQQNKMKKTAFTICAKNYIGLALALEKSIKSYNKEVDFYIFIADEFDDKDAILAFPKNVIVAKNALDINIELWQNMSFKYDLTEFCTSIKPSCFKYIFKNLNPDACIYFDPDILIFNTLDVIYNSLENYSIVLTPHTTTIETNYTGNLSEKNLLYSGLFNLGFSAIKNNEDGNKLVDWWENRLEDRCFQIMMEHYFTDQKWMDFIPSFFSKTLLVSSNLGLNVAPWNFYEREIIKKDKKLYVKNRITNREELYPLTFVHFSGFNYKLLLNGSVEQGNIKGMNFREDYTAIFNIYSKFILESDFSRYVKYNYTYNYFSNGDYISIVYRRLYRRLSEDNKFNMDPFNVNNSFYKSLKKNRVLNNIDVQSDKLTIDNVENVSSKLKYINKFFNFLFFIVGSDRFFKILKLMRIYSKVENHVYLINDEYYKNFEPRK